MAPMSLRHTYLWKTICILEHETGMAAFGRPAVIRLTSNWQSQMARLRVGRVACLGVLVLLFYYIWPFIYIVLFPGERQKYDFVVSWYVHTRSFSNSRTTASDHPIFDFAYYFAHRVNGSDPVWIEEYHRHVTHVSPPSPAAYRELGDELRFALRSIYWYWGSISATECRILLCSHLSVIHNAQVHATVVG